MTPDELDRLADQTWNVDDAAAWRVVADDGYPVAHSGTLPGTIDPNPRRAETIAALISLAPTLARDHAALLRWAMKAAAAIRKHDECDKCDGGCKSCVLDDFYLVRDTVLSEYDEKWGAK